MKPAISFQQYVAFLLVLICCSCHQGKIEGAQKDKDAFVFYVLGDWGTKGWLNQKPVAREMIKESQTMPPDMIITVGDNFYEHGVSSIHDSHWRMSYEDMYKDLTKNTPWYVSFGNHDYEGNMAAQIQYHDVNKNWNLPAMYYTFVKTLPDGEKARFVVLDTDPYITPYYSDPNYVKQVSSQDTARQTFWVDSILGAAKEPWKIVYGHHPLYCSHPRTGETEFLRAVMQPIFEKHGVQAYICGHEHSLQYNKPADNKVSYIISGGGAKQSQNIQKESFSVYTGNEPSFTVCTIKGDELRFQFVDTLGNTLYENRIAKKVQ